MKMKIAFCFLCKNKINNEAIWFDYFKGQTNCEIIIHFSETADLEFLNQLENVHISVNKVLTSWGSLQRGQNYLMDIAKTLDCKKFVILSDSCLPVKSYSFFYESMNNNMCYIRYCELWDETRFPIKYDWLIGNHQWCIIDSSKYELFLKSEYREHFESSVFLPEESYYSSILNHANLLNDDNVVSGLSTFAQWFPNQAHPYHFMGAYNQNDLDIVKKCIDDPSIFFIRKMMNIENEEMKNLFDSIQ
jgi:hypothetical protein